MSPNEDKILLQSHISKTILLTIIFSVVVGFAIGYNFNKDRCENKISCEVKDD